MRPSLLQCFPHPFTRQWPTTGNAATCECRQLYALVSVCCCVPNTHLLVLHESTHLNSNLITSMPKGPKYVDFSITPRTTPDDLRSFLVRAEMAAAAPHHFASPGISGSGGSAFNSVPPSSLEEASVFSPRSPSESRNEVSTSTMASASAAASMSRRSKSPLARSVVVTQRQVVVVCLHGIADASPAVQSTLMDLLMFEQVRTHHRAVCVPTLRIVAFCSSRNYAMVLPESLRALFTLSTYVSTLASDSAVVLQTATSTSSNIVNKRFMLEVMTSPDGQSLLETVTLSGTVTRYLRHLLLVLRGSFAAGMSPGVSALRRIPRWNTILKAFAILFMPDEDQLRARGPQVRSALLQSYNRAGTTSMALDRTSHSAVYRSSATAAHRLLSPESRGTSGVASMATRRAGGDHGTAEERNEISGGGGGGLTPSASIVVPPSVVAIESFSNVVVSPSDVVCVLPCLLAHLMTLPREMVPSEAILSAAPAMLGNAAGASSLVDIYGGMLDIHRRTEAGFSIQDPAMWDAVAASWPLRTLNGIANPARGSDGNLDDSFMSNNSAHKTKINNSVTLYSLESGEVMGEAGPGGWGLRRAWAGRSLGGGSGAGNSANTLWQDPLMTSPSFALPQNRTGHPLLFHTLNNRPLFTVAEAWRWAAVNRFGVLDPSASPMLDYWEVREVMRATLLCRSSPAPG